MTFTHIVMLVALVIIGIPMLVLSIYLSIWRWKNFSYTGEEILDEAKDFYSEEELEYLDNFDNSSEIEEEIKETKDLENSEDKPKYIDNFDNSNEIEEEIEKLKDLGNSEV